MSEDTRSGDNSEYYDNDYLGFVELVKHSVELVKPVVDIVKHYVNIVESFFGDNGVVVDDVDSITHFALIS